MAETNDHVWTNGNVAVYLAGGLPDDERVRFESHVSSCGKCLEELQDAQAAEVKLAELFKDDRPKPGLEDRVIQAVRKAPEPTAKINPGVLRIVRAVAAVVAIGTVGYVADRMQTDPEWKADFLSETNFHGRMLQGIRGEMAGAEAPRSQPAHGSPDAPSAEQMAQQSITSLRRQLEAGAARRPPADMNRPTAAEESDHNEFAIDDFAQTKGDRLRDVRKFSEAEKKELSKDAYSTFRDEGPAPVADPGFYRPGDAAARSNAPAPPKADAPGEKEAMASLAGKKAEEQRHGTDNKRQDARQDPPNPNRKIIRTGQMEFEIESFDSSVEKITKIVVEENGFVGTVNSDRLPNGKVRGTITVRVPPDRLDTLILKLRALGDLKSQSISSEDVTKQYTDTESQLRAARTMEARLIDIIKTGKGEIKDILAAEQELGRWREKIEVFEGQLRYWANQVAMSTLHLTLFEKDIRQPSGIVETEVVQMSVEAEDVAKSYQTALGHIADAKGRVTLSNLQKLQGGQFAAQVHAEVAPEHAAALRDKLSLLGRVTALDVQRNQQNEGGPGRALEIKVKRNDTVLRLSLYNILNVQPRETHSLSVAALEIEPFYRTLTGRIEKVGGRVVTATFNRQPGDRSTARIHFEVPTEQADALLLEIRAAGEVIDADVSENPDTANVTRAKKGFVVNLMGLGALPPRESNSVQLAAADVAESFRALKKAVADAKGRLQQAQLNENNKQDITATLAFDALTKEAATIDAAIRAAGWTIARTVHRTPEGQPAVESKTTWNLTVYAAASLGPRFSHVLAVEVKDVDKAFAELKAAAAEAKARIQADHIAKDRAGKIVGRLTVDVPLGSAPSLIERMKGAGHLRVAEVSKNERAPEGDLAFARIDLTLSNEDLIIPTDDGFGKQIREGLAGVFAGAGWSIKILLIGSLVVVPWALVIWGLWKLAKRLRKPAPARPA